LFFDRRKDISSPFTILAPYMISKSRNRSWAERFRIKDNVVDSLRVMVSTYHSWSNQKLIKVLRCPTTENANENRHAEAVTNRWLKHEQFVLGWAVSITFQTVVLTCGIHDRGKSMAIFLRKKIVA
jgi:hypothetical protein